MLFQTPEFLILMLLVLAGLSYFRACRPQHVLLVVASYVFYAWLDVRFLILLLISSTIDFMGALGIAGVKLSWRERGRLSLLTIGGAYFCLGLNWPLLQSNDAPANWIWAEFFQPSMTPSIFWLAFGTCVVFAMSWPLLYQWFFTFSERNRRNSFLWASMTANLGMLGLFKYGDFFLRNWSELLNWWGISYEPYQLDLALPPGISFYTFVTMSYGIDAWRRKIVPERSFLRMALFVSYFPHLVAGPVIRPDQLLPALQKPWRLREERIVSGMHLALVGLVKKILVADWVSKLVVVLLGKPDWLAAIPTIGLWLGSLLFAVQIYCDFSGYTDMARGVSRMLGVELPINFDFPYFSTNIAEFWHRWHISLSTWLRDYLYIPLGGNRCSTPRIYFNLLTTMILGGLWHGASWNFVIWGAYHGILLTMHRVWKKFVGNLPGLVRFLNSKLGNVLSWVLTMYLVMLGWMIFYMQQLPLWRGPSNTEPVSLLELIQRFVVFDGNRSLSNLGLGNGSPAAALLAFLFFAIMHTISFFRGRWAERFDRWSWTKRIVLYIVLGFILYFGWPTEHAAFIYFQF